MKTENENANSVEEHEEFSDVPSSPDPPKNSGIVLGFIIVLLLGLALALGVVAGPLITGFFAEGIVSQKSDDEAMAGHNHGAGGAGTAVVAEESSWYVCTMHPWVVQPEPGVCPICAMDLTPLDPNRFSGEIAIDPVVLQNIGVRVRPVVVRPLEKEIRTVGTVDYDETRVVDVNLKVSGWVEKINVDFLGAEVRKDQPLLEIYAPELYSTQDEYLLLWKNRDTPGNEKLLAAARNRLAFYDISDEQIAALEQSGKANKTMVIRAPADGVVIEKTVNSGMKVSPGSRLYRIADLKKVWVLATVYEHQLPYISLDQTVKMSLSYDPGKSREGIISYIYPFVDEKTREVQVRLEFDNRDGKLKPGMFADIEVLSRLAEGEKILAPRESIIDTGQRKIAFVSLGSGKFEPRNVTTGYDAGDGMIEIRDGLNPGEQVVVSGQFLLDSESRIRESLAKMIKGDLATEQLPEAEFLGPKEIVNLPAAAQEGISGAMDAYLAIQDDLYNSTTAGLRDKAMRFSAQLEKATALPPPGNLHFWHEREEVTALKGHAKQLAAAKNIQQARIQFGYIGEAFNELLRYTGIPESHSDEIVGLRCGMFESAPEGGIWLQTQGKARNPFFGSESAMKSCSAEQWNLPGAGGVDLNAADNTEQIQQMNSMDHTEHQPVAMTESVTNENHSDRSSHQVDDAYKRLLDSYVQMHDELFRNSINRLPELGENIQKAGMEMDESPEIDKIRQYAAQLVKASDMESARIAFGYLGIEMNKLLEKKGFPDSLGFELEGRKCGMFSKAPEGGVWVQVKGKVQNPFFGAEHAMATCAPTQWDYTARK